MRVMGFSIWIESRDTNYPVDHHGPVVALLVHAVMLLMGLLPRVTLPVLNCRPNRYSNHLQTLCRPGCSYYYYHHHQFLCPSSTETKTYGLLRRNSLALAMRCEELPASAMFHVCAIERIWSQHFFGIVWPIECWFIWCLHRAVHSGLPAATDFIWAAVSGSP